MTPHTEGVEAQQCVTETYICKAHATACDDSEVFLSMHVAMWVPFTSK